MAFKIGLKGSTAPDTPEALLQDIKVKSIPGALSHQSDIWRYYQEQGLDKKDVAIQLPTGSGKTLVGIVLAEWRRRKFNEKVVYLCPTKQLVNQVVSQSLKYGIKVTGFTGSNADYNFADKISFSKGDTIAITTYSSIFNSNSYFSDADILILDDAHASENYISNYWTLNINRFSNNELYKNLVELISHKITTIDRIKMLGKEENIDYGWVEKLSTKDFFELKEPIIQLLNNKCTEGDLYFSWKAIKDNLHACHFYMSSTSIIIRPIIPPTSTLTTFSKPKQRIYMSATLGIGGDLERLTGIEKIHRLPVPSGWDIQGVGRRFFIFPEMITEKKIKDFLEDIIKISNRSVYLVTDDIKFKEVKENIEKLGYLAFGSKEIEESKQDFINSDNAVAVLSNRYDGIDFPDNESHTLIIDGLQTATNLQEKFLMSRMAAGVLLEGRIMTRTLQAIGRCTRSLNDYSLVVVVQDELVKNLISSKNKSMLHPEIQAEINFGLEQYDSITADEMLENIKVFFKQGDEWKRIEEYIIELRSTCTQNQQSCVEALTKSVGFEVKYNEYLWNGDYLAAIEEVKKVLSTLEGEGLKGYKSLWNYLIASAYELKDKDNFKSIIKSHYTTAKRMAPSLKWLIDLSDDEVNIKIDSEASKLVEKFENKILELGISNIKKYNNYESYILNFINGKDGKKFEKAQTDLGNLIGYYAYNEETNGSPDPIWILDDDTCIVFEDYTEATAKQTLNITKARQATTHDNWIKEYFHKAKEMDIIKVLVTNAEGVDEGVLAHLKDVYLVKTSDFSSWTIGIIGELRTLREKFVSEGDLFWRNEAMEIYKQKLSSSVVREFLTKVNAYNYYKR